MVIFPRSLGALPGSLDTFHTQVLELGEEEGVWGGAVLVTCPAGGPVWLGCTCTGTRELRFAAQLPWAVLVW